MNPTERKDFRFRTLFACIALMLMGSQSGLSQTPQFAANAPLFFTMPAGGSNPLPQFLSLLNTASSYISVDSATATTASGGTWLAVTNGCSSCVTPAIYTAAVNGVALPAGTYTGQIVFSGTANVGGGHPTLTIPVTLAVVSPAMSQLSGLTGGLTFVAGNSFIASSQTIAITNGGSGSLTWTAKVVNGSSSFLSVSAANGTGPSMVTVSVATQGLAAGTYLGQVLFQGANGSISVPVSLTIVSAGTSSLAATSTFSQVPALNFTMAAGGSNPLPQTISLENTGTSYIYINSETTATSTGGSWLGLSSSQTGVTPSVNTVVINASALPAGTYTGQVTVLGSPNTATATALLIVPVTLTVVDPAQPLLQSLPGGLTFVTGNGYVAAPQTFEIGNGGSGVMNWSAATAMFRSSSVGSINWLSVSSASGASPSFLTVSIAPQGLAAGNYIGSVTVMSATGSISVPVLLRVVDSSVTTFSQVSGLNFTLTAGGANPLPQPIAITSTGSSYIDIVSVSVGTGSGGNWLSVNPACNGCVTPANFGVSVDATALPAGVYTGQVTVQGLTSSGAPYVTIPVMLTVSAPGAPLLGALAGGFTFVAGNGYLAAPQNLQIPNAGSGSAGWTAAVQIFRTATVGIVNWLSISAASGTAPSVLSVSVSPQGLATGIYSGQVVLTANNVTTTIPISLTVVDSTVATFQQAAPLSFTIPAGGPNPLVQFINLDSTGSSDIYVNSTTVTTGSGGNWLSVAGCTANGCPTPGVAFARIDASTLPAGTYSGQISFARGASGGSIGLNMIVPVTLTVVPVSQPAVGGAVGGLSFFSSSGGSAPAAQVVQLTNVGSGVASWTASASIFRTGTVGNVNWLSLASASGSAPSQLSVSVSPQGLGSGTYLGQVLVQSTTGSLTIPISLVVSDSTTNTFQQLPALSFSMPVGGPNPLPQTVTVKSTSSGFNWSSSYFQVSNGDWLQVAGCGNGCSSPSTYTATVSGLTLPAGIYTGQEFFIGPTALVVPIVLTVGNPATAPSVNAGGVVPVYSSVNTVQPGEWVSIYGNNLATSTVVWTGAFTTSLGGTSVTIDGKPAYLSVVSPGQINLQVPDDTARGSVPVVVTTPNGTATSSVQLAQFGPSFSLLDSTHVAGIILRFDGSGAFGGGSYDIVGPTGNSLGYPTVAARAGDSVVLFGVGFGPTNPAVPAGQSFSGQAAATNTVNLLINNSNLTPSFAGLSSAGLFQFNLTIPAGLGTGDVPLVGIVGGVHTPSNVVISLR
jgi:uncharacterized protein (TIGR03437 family)